MKKIFLIIAVSLCLNAFSMHEQKPFEVVKKISTSKKRKLRRNRAIQARAQKEELRNIVINKFYIKENKPTAVPLKLWWPDEIGYPLFCKETESFAFIGMCYWMGMDVDPCPWLDY